MHYSGCKWGLFFLFKDGPMVIMKYMYIYIFFIRVSGLTIATDLICGFPTETEEVDHLFIFFYYRF